MDLRIIECMILGGLFCAVPFALLGVVLSPIFQVFASFSLLIMGIGLMLLVKEDDKQRKNLT